MSEIADRGSIYDRIINEKWISTPDMGEYMSSKIYKSNIEGASENTDRKIGPEFYVENPVVTSPGYDDNLKVIAFNVNGRSIYNEHMNDTATDRNVYDGDTVYLSTDEMIDTNKSFKVYYDDNTVFTGVKDYITRTLKLEAREEDDDTTESIDNSFGIRFVGINAPECIHYGDYTTNNDDSDVYKTTFGQLINNNTTVDLKGVSGRVQANKNNVNFRPFKEVEQTVNGVKTIVYEERDPNEEVEFVRFYLDKERYPSVTNSEREVFYEYVKTVKDTSTIEDANGEFTKVKVKRLVTYADSDIYQKGIEYANQSKKAQKIVREAFRDSLETMIIVDAIGLNGVKSEIPEKYKKSYESSKYNPFYVLWDMWKTIIGKKYAYRYASYQAPGVESNGRFLAAVYVKLNINGVAQWVNLNKKVLYECSMTEARPTYSDSVDNLVNNNYLSNGFKLWTYNINGQLYVDGIDEELYATKDDRAEIQEKICGVDLNEMTNHTVMIGDCLLMVPPTSIKVSSQTKVSKTHLIRAKGAVQKQLPKTERIIQMDLYFNTSEGINGIPIERQLPNGSTKTYYMNGLRSLIAQFKLTPFMPIHNHYINETLGIDAVSLASYSVSTVPNYPRTLQVTIMLYEFAWMQYMPSQAIPLSEGDNLYKNGFSETIHFPLLRFYYQQALERGAELVTGSLAGLEPNDERYIAATLGNKTALQPINFMQPTIDFYLPDEDLLKVKKQLKIAMQTRPLGKVFSFNDSQESFISKMFYLNKLSSEVYDLAEKYIPKMTTVSSSDIDVVMIPAVLNGEHEFTDSRAAEILHAVVEKNNKLTIKKDRKTILNEYVQPVYDGIVSIYNSYSQELGSLLKEFKIVTKSYSKSGIYYYKIAIRFTFNSSFFEANDDLDEIRQYVAKYHPDSLDYDTIFPDDSFEIYYVSEFGVKEGTKDRYIMNKPMKQGEEYSISAIQFLAGFSDEKEDGTQNFKIEEVLENIKNSTDEEDETSIKFNKIQMSENKPIITSMVSSYNNIFANVGLKAIDGHASQYTGGSDATLDIEMVGDEDAVAVFTAMHRKCVQYLIDYRKVLLSSPLRIDSEFTRLLGLHEVIIEALQIDTIPEVPGKFTITMRLNSVDRTLRNRESLNRLKDIDNSQMQYNQVAQTKSYFDLKESLGKAELYPDLDLPTITELQQAGFYFLKSKFQPERVYPDPDFYFLYWYPTVAENLRTTLTEYFSEPSNFNYSLSGDLFKDKIDMQIKVANGNGESFYDILNWDERDKTYEDMVNDLKELSMSVDSNSMSEEDKTEFAEVLAGKMKELDALNAQISSLQETLELATYNTYLVNSLTNVTVKDYEVLDVASDSMKSEIQANNKKIKELIIEELKQPIEYRDYSTEHVDNDFSYKHKNDDTLINSTKKSFLKKLFKAMFDVEDDISKVDYRYISTITKAAAVGASAKQPFYSSSNPYKISTDNLCLPELYIQVTDANGDLINVPKCYYSADNGEVLVAHDDKTREKGIIFGDFEIKKYDGSQLGKILNTTNLEDGFLDPYYHKDIAKKMFKENVSTDEMDTRIANYKEGVMKDRRYAQEAHFRQMLVWLYVLLDENTLLGNTLYYASKTLKMINECNDNATYRDDKIEYLIGLIADDVDGDEEEEENISVTIDDKTFKKQKNNIDSVLGEGSYENLKDSIEEQKETVYELFKTMSDEIEEYIPTLIHGVMFTLSSIAMSGLNSSILSAIRQGSIYQYKSIIDTSLSANSLNDLTEEQKRMVRFAQYCCYYLDEEKRHIKTDFQKISYNNKIQRAYLAAANEPSVYMLHSFYDMVINDKRGSMARAFPTYYMLLIDEGRTIGYWKLQDNFYNMNSISEFEVVKSRKVAADTARIVMSNMYGVFNADDEDMKDENEYTMRDVWDSIFSPRTYFQKEYDRRENARDINYAKMQPGARVHLRMGYSSNAAELPIVFNGVVAEFENGELMTLVCQGDGIEISNPHMFNSLDATDVEDIKYSDEFFGIKQFLEAWNSLSTPRSMLVNPLAAEGTWIQKFIKKWSSGRFFNANPFGIVHFGDRRYTDIFSTNGEVEQNIYEGLSSPTWDYKKCNIDNLATKGITEQYAMAEAPSVRVSLSSGFSYWDLMHIASSLSPDFISAVAPFQLRSTIFHGHPRFYYAYDYITLDGQVIEKRKPFQQYHIYTSYNDIIDNRITTSSTDVRTNAVGHYIGPSWLSSEPKTVGPLFVDIDIFPEYQKSTSINLNYEYKNSDFMPFTIPIADKLIDTFNWVDKPNGEKTAWRATANGLKDCIKEMYQGELIVLGDPSVKPFDKITICDTYEDVMGNVEVESVVHMFSVDTGFTTSITPDCISAIDNNYETMYNSINAQVVLPALVADTMLINANIYFHSVNRPLYLAMSRLTKQGVNLANTAVDTVMTMVGKDAVARDALAMNSSMPKALSEFLMIDTKDIQLADMISDLLKGKNVFNTTKVAGAKSFLNIVNDLDKMDEIVKTVSLDKYNDLIDLLGDSRYSSTGVQTALKNASEYTDAINSVTKALTLSKSDAATLAKTISDLNLEDDAIKAAINILENSNGLDLTSKEGKTVLKGLKNIGNYVDDFTGSASSLAKILEDQATTIKNSLKTLDKIEDVVSPATTVNGVKSLASLMKNWKSILLNNVLMLAVEFVVTKSAQEYLTRALKNLQVLTIYPLKKDGIVWTAGINGHQGSVFGSLTYDTPGWLEQLAIKFFDYGNDSSWTSPARYLALLRDMFVTTDEMKDIVNGYKRGNGYTVESQSDEKIATERQLEISQNIAMKDVQSYSDYKNIYFTERLTMEQIQSNAEEANLAYATYKISSMDIEKDKNITKNLNCIISDTKVINNLYFNDCFKLAYDFNYNDVDNNKELGLTIKKIPIHNGDGAVQEVYAKEVGNYTPKVYDIPYLRPDAMILLNHVVDSVLKVVQPDYTLDTCKFEEIKKTPFILHSATMVNSTEGWRSTGYLFTLEVKNYDNFSNIIKEINEQKEEIVSTLVNDKQPFTIINEAANGYNKNTYSFFVHCPVV